MPDYSNLNLAHIVYRLLTSARGWPVNDLIRCLGIADRTYRSYRRRLQDHFLPLMREDGTSMVEEVREGERRILRLIEMEETAHTDSTFLGRMAALYMAQQMFQFLRETDVGEAMEDIVRQFQHQLKDRPFVLRHLLRNVNRLFYQVPDAPKDYSGKSEIIKCLLHALVHTLRIRVVYDSASKGERELVLEPFSLLTYRSGMYLLARCPPHQDVRTYVVDRLVAAEKLAEKFDYPLPSQFRPQTYTEGCFGIFREGEGQAQEVVLVFADKRWLKMYIRERRWHPTQVVSDLPDGRLRLTFEVSSLVEVWPWVRSFGRDVEVVRPDFPDDDERTDDK